MIFAVRVALNRRKADSQSGSVGKYGSVVTVKWFDINQRVVTPVIDVFQVSARKSRAIIQLSSSSFR